MYASRLQGVSLQSKYIVSTRYSDLGGPYDAYRDYNNYETDHLLPFSDSEYLLSRGMAIQILITCLLDKVFRLDLKRQGGVYGADFESVIQLAKNPIHKVRESGRNGKPKPFNLINCLFPVSEILSLCTVTVLKHISDRKNLLSTRHTCTSSAFYRYEADEAIETFDRCDEGFSRTVCKG